MPSARELSIGITKLSGSNPRLKVKRATAKEITMIEEAAIKLAANNTAVNLKRVANERIPWIRSDKTE